MQLAKQPCMRCAILVVFLVACDDYADRTFETDIADLDGLVFDIDLSRTLYLPVGEGSIHVEIYDTDPGCEMLSSSTRLLANDTPLSVSSRGGQDTLGFCETPAFHGTLAPPPANLDLVLASDSMSVTAKLGDLLLPRSATLVPDRSWVFMPGETVTVRWFPSTDFVGVSDPVVQVHLRDTTERLTTTVASDLLTFTVPNVTDSSAYLTIDVPRNAGSFPCTTVRAFDKVGGAASCRVRFDPFVRQDISIGP